MITLMLVLAFASTAGELENPSVQAEPAAVAPQISFSQLAFAGSVGALIGGIGGAAGVYVVCINMFPRGPWADLACMVGSMYYGYMPGIPIGATVGVSISGGLRNARGNVGLALIGATAGAAAGVLVVTAILRILDQNPGAERIKEILTPAALLLIIPVSAGCGAAWGYATGMETVPDNR